MGPDAVAAVPKRRGEGAQKEEGRGHVKKEVEAGGMRPGGLPGAPRSWRRREGASLEPSEGAGPCRHLDLRLLASGL